MNVQRISNNFFLLSKLFLPFYYLGLAHNVYRVTSVRQNQRLPGHVGPAIATSSFTSQAEGRVTIPIPTTTTMTRYD